MSVRTSLLVLVLIAAFAIVYRGGWIGNPLPYEDEQFYLLVGNRIWHGDLPYVDIWDRKPIGLFLLYAAFVPFGGHGLVAYQVGALVFTIATAFLIARFASRLTNTPAAVGAAILYIVNLQVFGGQGGQSPVFYNLLMVGAALLVADAWSGDTADHRRAGLVAMLLAGLAIQIKYTAFVEGVYFGLCLLWCEWRRVGSWPKLALVGVALITVAVLPTAIAFGWYAWRGDASAFLQANFLSIFQTVDPQNGASLENLQRDLYAAVPFIAVGLAGMVVLAVRRPWPALYPFLLGWMAFAALGFAVIGRFYAHYLIPSFVPLAILAAPAMASAISLGAIVGIFVAVTSGAYVADAGRTVTRYRDYVDAMTRTMQPYTRYGCLYLHDGPVMVYVETGSCLPTPYVFPDHLSKVMESKATDATASMARLLAGKPAAIAVSTRSTTNPPNPVTTAMLANALATGYRKTAEITEAKGDGRQVIYVRSDLP